MGLWQSSWWLYTWGGTTWDSGNPAGGYILWQEGGGRGGGGG